MHSLTPEARLQGRLLIPIYLVAAFSSPTPHMHALGWSSELEVLGITVQTKFLAATMEVPGVPPGAAETERAAWQGIGWPQGSCE